MLGPGDRIGPLTIERGLGVGGMGEVYLARDDRLERLVAVKLLPASSGMDPGAHARMLREARSLSALKHPSIVTIHDIGTHAGLSYLVMEYVDGETFDEVIKRRGALPPAEAVAVLAQVCDAVAAAHDAGVLHRDLKSANLMIERGGRVMVLDFGLSKRTEGSTPSASSARWSAPRLPAPAPAAPPDVANAPTVVPVADVATDATTPAPATDVGGDATTPASSQSGGPAGSAEPQTVHGAGMGTPGWAPPELIEGRAADARTDVFSLGCVLYHLLTGQPPFPKATWATQRERIEAGPTPPSRTPGVPVAFDAVIASALDPDPARRPADVRALVAAARGALARPRRRRAIAIGAGGAVVGGGAAIAIALALRSTGPAPRVDAAPLPPPEPVQLTTLGGCAYSPTFADDDTVVFDLTRDDAVDLYRLDLAAGSTPVRLTSDPGWEWRTSPGATRDEVVFQVQRDKLGSIDALNLVTGARRTLIAQEGPVASAGGAYYYAPSGPTVRRIRDGHDEPLLTAAINDRIDSIVASPDGKQLAVVLFDEKTMPALCTVDVDHPVFARVDVAAGSGRPAFSAAGDALYYVRLDKRGIARVATSGGAPVDVLPGVNGIGGLAVSPSGRALVYSNCTSRNQMISVLDDPGAPMVDDDDASGPVVGPDGMVLWIHRVQPRPRIMVRTRDGTTRELYVRPNSVLGQLAIDDDGDTLAFVVAEQAAPGIYLTRLTQSSPPNRITENARDLAPVIAGDRVLFTRVDEDGTPHLMRVGVDGSGAEEVSTRPRKTIAEGGGRVLLTSPDHMSYYWWDPKTGRESPGPALPGNTPPSFVGLSPDGRWVMFAISGDSLQLWRVRTDTRAPAELVYTLPGDRSALTGTIDDRGHPIVVEDSWVGELFLVRANPGAPW